MKNVRYPELDALRGIAVICMIVYHFLFDLSYFYDIDIPVRFGLWKFFAQSTASLFLLLVGICFVISWHKTPCEKHWKKAIRRAVPIISGGMVISLFTWFVTPHAFIKFGILHLIGISALLQPLFLHFRCWNLLIGSGIFFMGMVLNDQTTNLHWLFPIGIPYLGFQSLDYYPILPWFGMILIGMGLAYHLYIPKSRLLLQYLSSIRYPSWLIGCGKNALLLYFLHQPVLLLLLYFVFLSI
jgi:uncharacterized membrane protein